jgi:hypothetical protein
MPRTNFRHVADEVALSTAVPTGECVTARGPLCEMPVSERLSEPCRACRVVASWPRTVVICSAAGGWQDAGALH